MVDGSQYVLLGILVGIVAIVGAYLRLWPWIRRLLYIPPAGEWRQGEPSADATTDAPSADQAYFAFAERLLDSQLTTSDVLDTKIAGTIGVGSTVLPVTFGLLSLSERTPPLLTEWLLGVAVVAYLTLLVSAWRASRIRALEYRPDLRVLWEHSQAIDGAALRRWIAEEYAASAELNRPLMVRKAQYVGIANVALVLEGILISLAAAVSLAG